MLWSDFIRVRLWLVHRPPLHIVIQTLHTFQPLPEYFRCIVHIVISGCPDSHPALGVVQPFQAAEEVRQRMRSVAGENDHEHRGFLRGRLGERHRFLSVLIRVGLGGEARPAAEAEQGGGQQEQRAGDSGEARSHVP